MIETNQRTSVEALSKEQRNRLETELLRRFAVQKKSIPQHRDRSASCPLSYAQESVWFFDKLQPNSPLYIIPQAFRLVGKLDVPALQSAFASAVQRHEALRTVFLEENGQAVQVIREANFQLATVDASHLAASEREVEMQRLLKEEATRPFDLSQDPMLRASLLRFSDEEHVLTVALHHIVSDFGSLGILWRDLDAFYEACPFGEAPTLSPLPSQLADFAFFQREHWKTSQPNQHMDYWKSALAGPLLPLELPYDRPRMPEPTFRGSRLPIHLPADVANQLKVFCRQEGVTLNMALLSVFKLLLHRYSAQDDIIVGLPLGQRTAATENLIGFFINTLPVRTDFSGNPTFQQLLGRVRETVFGTIAHGEVPFEKLIEDLRLPRQDRRNPIFQTVFQYLGAPFPKPKLGGIAVEALKMDSGTSKFDLTFTLTEAEGGGIQGDMEFNTDLFDAASITRLLRHFEVLLGAAVAHPHESISKLPLLTESEYSLVTQVWNGTKSNYPQRSIHDLFASVVDQYPGQTAVMFGETRLTYHQLHEQSNRLAHFLLKSGVTPNSRVGICMERSLELIVSLLGILKAGAAYVPLDASYPAERLAFLLADSGAAAVITASHLSHPFPASATIINYDLEKNHIDLESATAPVIQVSAVSMAYVIYTSGSTGKPKGVAIPHRGVVRLVQNTNYLSFSSDDVFLQFAPVSFDASTLEIWGPLLNGAKLAIFPARFESIEQLGQVLGKHEVTTLWLTAGLFHQVIEHHIVCLKNVRHLLAGGDILSVPHVLKMLREIPNTRLINGYGPTENTTFTCCYHVPPGWTGKSVPIGKPLSNTQVYVLGKDLLPVPIGVAGELYISGDGLALEYLNSPELTREKFVRNPFSLDPSSRLYRSGDIVRWMDDGNIEFIGRRDNQIKVRGFRIELGEVEHALAQCESVQETVVVAREEATGAKYLVAYFVLKPGVTEGEKQIRSYCAKALPGYMIPQLFVILDKFPLTENGKIDRRALPIPRETQQTTIPQAPRTPVELSLTQIWQEVLAIKTFGIQDNFFFLGGHSLLATRIISRINEAHQTNLALGSLFEHPTIAALAQVIEEAQKQAPVAPIVRRNRGRNSS